MKKTSVLYFYICSIIFLLAGCAKELSVEQGKSFIPATGSLKDSNGLCMGTIVHGTYYNGVTPGSDTCYAEVIVDVATAGTYKIYTNVVNGFMFSDSGFFDTPGIDTIRLLVSGTPILNLPSDFALFFDTSVCAFTVNVLDSTGHGAGGGGLEDSDSAWQFTGSTTAFKGPVDEAYIKDSLGAKVLVILGSTAATGDSSFAAGIVLPGGFLSPGTFSTSTGAFIYFADENDEYIYSADPFTIGFVMSVTIDGYDTDTKIVTGSFSGTAKDADGNGITISGGKFTAKVE